MDKSRYENRSNQWRKRTGAKLRRARRLAGVPKRLVFMTVAGAAALVTQFIVQHSERLPETNLSSWIGPTPAPIAGVASVIDGDTIEIHGQRIRFNGIDAPESRQYCSDAKGFEYPCGRRAAETLNAFLAMSKPVRCTFVTWDQYRRYVGDCTRADGAGVASWMVEHGQALDWPRYSRGAYAGQQAKAQAANLGLWGGTFQAPWEWRTEHSENPRPATSQPLGIISDRQLAQGYACQPRRTCSQISSCDEANWYLVNCSWGGKLDRDRDGIACETLC
ncbi:excalibur calcium-binding domain-containing protein [Mesorhizobium sp. ISC25]|uniref:thermonuclease family protein n=1 Tax=Mesorhizobium sp. ISC25 TaxID=3077335 RepID=UPI0035DF235F